MEEILKMIESVDPSDTAKLDEIDARVTCLVKGITFIKPNIITHKDRGQMVTGWRTSEGDKSRIGFCRRYTRSRDALKAIRPEGWMVCGHYALATALGYTFSLHEKKAGGKQVIGGGLIKTEELAELHAIIQAINHERKESDNERE